MMVDPPTPSVQRTPAEQFRAAIVLTVLLVAICAGLTYSFYWWMHGRHVPLIMATAEVNSETCRAADQPVYVELRNGSSKTIERASVRLVAKRPGRSSEVTKYTSLDIDHIVSPGRKLTACAIADLIDDAKGEDPRLLEWTARVETVKFSE